MFEKDSSHNYSLTLNMRQLSLAVACLFGVCFFIFVGGYFLGQKKAAQDFAYRLDQESLADQIYSSMCVLYDSKDDAEDAGDTTEENEISETVEQPELKEENVIAEVSAATTSTTKYKVPLAGFSQNNLTMAQKMVARLSARGFAVELVEHTSKAPKGKTIVWHQVVTKPYATKESLLQAIGKIAKLENLSKESLEKTIQVVARS